MKHEQITVRNALQRTSALRTWGYSVEDEADHFIEESVCFHWLKRKSGLWVVNRLHSVHFRASIKCQNPVHSRTSNILLCLSLRAVLAVAEPCSCVLHRCAEGGISWIWRWWVVECVLKNCFQLCFSCSLGLGPLLSSWVRLNSRSLCGVIKMLSKTKSKEIPLFCKEPEEFYFPKQ